MLLGLSITMFWNYVRWHCRPLKKFDCSLALWHAFDSGQ